MLCMPVYNDGNDKDSWQEQKDSWQEQKRDDYVPASALLHSSPSFMRTLPTSLISIPSATFLSSSARLES